jgi:hypothetical protein
LVSQQQHLRIPDSQPQQCAWHQAASCCSWSCGQSSPT